MTNPTRASEGPFLERAYYPADNQIATAEQKAHFWGAVAQAKSAGVALDNREAYAEAINQYEEKTLVEFGKDQTPPIETKTFVFEEPATREVFVTDVSIFPAEDEAGIKVLRVVESRYGGEASGAINFSERHELDHDTRYIPITPGRWATSGLATDTKIDFNNDGTVDERIIHHKASKDASTALDEHLIDADRNGTTDILIREKSSGLPYTNFDFVKRTVEHLNPTNLAGVSEIKHAENARYFTDEQNTQLKLTGYQNGFRGNPPAEK